MPSTIETLSKSARFLAVNVQTNGGNFGFHMIRAIPIGLCVRRPIGSPVGRRGIVFSSQNTVVEELLASAIDCAKIIVTQGKRGCVGYSRGEPTSWVPAFAIRWSTRSEPETHSSPSLLHWWLRAAQSATLRSLAALQAPLKSALSAHRQAVDK